MLSLTFRKLDISDLAVRSRADFLLPIARAQERDIDFRILTSTLWGEINQARSFCLPTSQPGGMFSVVRVGCGTKVVFVQSNVADEGLDAIPTSDFRRFFVAQRLDTTSAGVSGRWSASVVSGGGQM